MKRLLMTVVGVAVGLAACLLTLGLFVNVPADCGEPAACGDDYFLPAAYPAFGILVGFGLLAFLLGKEGQWPAFLLRIGLSVGIVVAILLIVRAPTGT